ncbi:pyridoxal reductase Plr1 [Yamadazyma tenuis]|uniref:Aldo/keto reductase n=1 Tax=Candida tenuis (strain ATCC 10573 / BCRC 21748 / CBS 615 / JCM 9827 / NBRC 10315 / NRRL Y-1498 / VKM Y-70) TaxID=590646 RepID=G3AVY4_CANTC|nr:Aldo/keto reductase [Yamadazyma tenuis ATCC 10573]EGV66899.1 Aldo/keto reductase [Yamadazyma tenuis ATCC 10573]WEJ95359.1 pyridoxal reductase Plr1 [Yamadazyma tenuis]
MEPVPITTKGFGTMSLTGTATPQPLDKSVATLKHVKDTYGVKFLDCGEFYQFNPEFHNLKLAKIFCEQEQDKDIVICVKGAFKVPSMVPDASPENLNKCIDETISYFKDLKVKPKIIYEAARVDKNYTVEDVTSRIYERVKAGDIDGVALSEVSAESIKKAASVAPISAIEVEFSLFSEDILKNGVLAEASKHQIPILAYSPVGRGLLTNYAAEHPDYLSTLSEHDFKRTYDWFQPGNFEKNKGRLTALYNFAKSKNLTLERLALSYLESLSGLENFLGIPKVTKIIPIPSGSTPEKVDRNYKGLVKLSREDVVAVNKILEEHPVYGVRYNAHASALLNG